MKKQLAIILSGALLLGSLYGCGDSGSGLSGKTTAYKESELAEGTDLRSALHVPDSVKETWHSNSGVTAVTVNAQVYFPAINGSVPTLEVTLRDMHKKEALQFAEAVFEEKTYYCVKYDKQSNSLKRLSEDKIPEIPYELHFYSEEKMDEERAVYAAELSSFPGNVKMEFQHRTTVSSFVYCGETALQSNGWAKNTSLSPEEARTKADQIVKHFAPYMECVEMNAAVGRNGQDDISKNDSELHLTEANMQGYIFHYSRPYAGIPTTYTNEECSETEGNPDGYAPSCYYESVMLVLSENGVEWVQWKQPYKVGDILNENVKLMSFDEIKDIAMKMIPLKYASSETYYNPNEVSIDRIKFGYTRVLMKDAPTRYMIIPVWDFIGTYDSPVKASGDSGKEINGWIFTINAVDGTSIDREYGY